MHKLQAPGFRRQALAITIRPARPDDREFLSDIAIRLADFDHPPSWRPAADLVAGDRRDLLAALENPPQASALVIAELDGAPAGCLHVVTRTDFFTLQPHGHISVIAVTKAAEGHGVGKRLMKEAENWARSLGYDHLSLSVFPANERALALYQRHGYAVDLISMRKGIG